MLLAFNSFVKSSLEFLSILFVLQVYWEQIRREEWKKMSSGDRETSLTSSATSSGMKRNTEKLSKAQVSHSSYFNTSQPWLIPLHKRISSPFIYQLRPFVNVLNAFDLN